MRKLKWREVVYVKGVVGSMSNENIKYNQDEINRMNADGPKMYLNGISKPYFEAGIGIENIFKVLRVDYIRRLSWLEPYVKRPYGFMATIQIIL